MSENQEIYVGLGWTRRPSGLHCYSPATLAVGEPKQGSVESLHAENHKEVE